MNRRTSTLLGGLLFAACVPINGGNDAGGGGCPDIACGPAYQVNFTRAGAWTEGTYTIEVTADGAPGSCEIIIPLSCERGPRCMGLVNWLPGLVGCALGPGQHSISGITFERMTPMKVEVRVSQAGRPLGMQSFAPVYQTSQGPPGCGLSCTQARTDQLMLTQ